MTERVEVILEPFEGHYYSVTTFNEQTISNNFETTRYYSTNPLKYVGKYIGGRIKEWAHFTNENGEEVIIQYNKEFTTAFYEVNPREIKVVLMPIVGKYYDATYWDRKVLEQHYTKTSTPCQYVGQYLRSKQIGCGDGADYWAILMLDNKEIEVIYDYEFKRAFYKVNIL